MDAKHTPGPWKAKPSLSRWNVTTGTAPRTFNICTINTDRLEQAENAALIAAAPDLLASLLEILDYEGGADSSLQDGYVMERIRAAIAKARGETA